jgi:hypothetical protein
MSQDGPDKRDYYRIKDRVLLEFKIIDPAIVEEGSDFPISVSPEFHLLNELHHIDSESLGLLHAIAEKDRNIATYMSAINHKIELLASVIAGSSEDLDEVRPQDATLGEGGLSFNHKEPVELGSKLAIKLTLLPSYAGLLLYGRVVNCNEHIKGDYLLNIEFENINDNNRQLIARHVLHYQAKARRAAGLNQE